MINVEIIQKMGWDDGNQILFEDLWPIMEIVTSSFSCNISFSNSSFVTYKHRVLHDKRSRYHHAENKGINFSN